VLDEETPADDEKKQKNEEEAKKKAEDIWAAFKQDTNFIVSKPKPEVAPAETKEEQPSSSKSKILVEEKVVSCDKKKEEPKIFEFAGETLV